MASTYTDNTGIEQPGPGEQSGTWGTTTNRNFDIIDRSLNGVGTVTLAGTSHTLTTSDGSLSNGHYRVLVLGGTPTGTCTITISPNDQDKLYFVHNDSGESATFTQGTGGNVTIADGQTKIIFADGAGAGAKVTDFSSVLDMSANTTSGVPPGTKQLFVQTSAPTGWTKDTSSNDNSAIRVTTGTASTGGTIDFATVFASQSVAGSITISGSTAGHAITTAQMPAHTHYNDFGGGFNSITGSGGSPGYVSSVQGGTTGSAGGNQAHSHGAGTLAGSFTGTAIDLDVKYVDVIVCTKD